jgi:hypothetical protein
MAEARQGSSITKWELTQEALHSALAGLPASVDLGMVFFPQVRSGSSECFLESLIVPFASLDAEQLESCANALASVEPDGNTPTYDAYAYAVEQLALHGAEGPKVIVLVTDGLPGFELGCVGTGQPPFVAWDNLVGMVGAANDSGIKTLAISAPGSPDTHEMLQAIAVAGGGLGLCTVSPSPSGCFFDLDASLDVGPWLAESLKPLDEACTR